MMNLTSKYVIFFLLYGPSSISFCVVKALEELKKGFFMNGQLKIIQQVLIECLVFIIIDRYYYSFLKTKLL